MARDLRLARDKGADFVITLIHWGIEYALKANAEQEQTARWLLDHGCDAVIGGHPHVVQNFTLDAIPDNNHYPEIVVYSMGNLVSNQRDVNCDGGIMIELDLQKTFFDTRVTAACRYMPYWVHRGTFDGLYQYYIVPSTDAVEHPDSYQISGDLLQALQRFSANTRARLDSCALLGGANITEPRDGKHHHHPGGPHHTPPQKPAETQYNADGIDMAIVRAFPDVKSINKTKKWTEVLNADGKLLGYAVYSKPASDGIKGYNGETPVLIALSKKKVIIGVWLLPNSETPRFTKRVEDAGFYNNWNGLSIKKARKKKVDAVSGATFTSRAVAESVQAALKAL